MVIMVLSMRCGAEGSEVFLQAQGHYIWLSVYSSPIADSENAKEDEDIDQEELCSPCQTDSKDEEYIITRGMLFFFNCEKRGHLEIEFHEGNEIEKLIEKEENYEA
jgi:hypothetical protein